MRAELRDLDRVVSKVHRGWEAVHKVRDDQDLYLDLVALNLHGFYSGRERLCEVIARHVDRNLASGPSWHEELLRLMAQDVAGVRPAVLGTQSVQRRDE